jgi:hypothetical protein
MTTTFTPRRSRLKRQASEREFEITDNDVFGFFEPLSRYGRLPTNHLIEFDRRYVHFRKNRLTTLYQETADYHARDQLLYRSEEQWRFGGMNGQAQYKLGVGVNKYLERYGLLDHRLAQWIPATKIGPHDDDHDLFLNLAVSSIELATVKTPVRFVNHLEILKNAPLATQQADEPFAIPIGTLAYQGRPPLERATLRPDALFGLEYDGGASHRFFAVEFDRGTEPIVADNLKRSSWLRKTLSYHKAYCEILVHLGIPQLYVLAIIPEKARLSAKDRAKNILKKAVLDVLGPSPIFCFQTYAPVRNFTTIKPPAPDLLVNPWKRAGHSDLLIHQH